MDKKKKEAKCFSCGESVFMENCKVQVVVMKIGVFYFCDDCFDKIFPYVKLAMKKMGFKGIEDISGEKK